MVGLLGLLGLLWPRLTIPVHSWNIILSNDSVNADGEVPKVDIEQDLCSIMPIRLLFILHFSERRRLMLHDLRKYEQRS